MPRDGQFWVRRTARLLCMFVCLSCCFRTARPRVLRVHLDQYVCIRACKYNTGLVDQYVCTHIHVYVHIDRPRVLRVHLDLPGLYCSYIFICQAFIIHTNIYTDILIDQAFIILTCVHTDILIYPAFIIRTYRYTNKRTRRHKDKHAHTLSLAHTHKY